MYQTSIGEILEEVPDPTAKNIIGAYDYQTTYKSNLKKITSFTVSDLEKCGTALGLKTRHENGTKVYNRKETLSDRIILQIESHFTETCDECEQKYRNKFNDTQQPLIHCFLCMQGSHNCEQLTEKFQLIPPNGLTGQVWLCRGCRIKNDTRPQPQRDTRPSVTFQGGNGTENNTGEVDEVPDEEPDEDKESPRRDTHTRANQGPRTICPLYKKHQCPHGASGKTNVNGSTCPHEHPRMCRKFCQFGKQKKGGCDKGKNCKFFHPILCKHSLRQKQCLNQDCTFTHLKFTRRFESTGETTSEYHPSQRQMYPPESDIPRALRPRRDSTNSRASITSDSYRTPMVRENYPPRNPLQPQKIVQHPQQQRASSATTNAFLEKLMESMKEGFSQQQRDTIIMKDKMDQQIEAIWSKLNTITNPATHIQSMAPTNHLHATMPPQIPQMWNPLPNPTFMC